MKIPVVSKTEGLQQDDPRRLLTNKTGHLGSRQSVLLADASGVMEDGDFEDRFGEIDNEYDILHGGLLPVPGTDVAWHDDAVRATGGVHVIKTPNANGICGNHRP